ncbi:hypothetical protein TNCV_3642001 [Trichonephila clavipes]|nr:hypothetical protein TNCV_3642001 [Trichonephila clavipes]
MDVNSWVVQTRNPYVSVVWKIGGVSTQVSCVRLVNVVSAQCRLRAHDNHGYGQRLSAGVSGVPATKTFQLLPELCALDRETDFLNLLSVALSIIMVLSSIWLGSTQF